MPDDLDPVEALEVRVGEDRRFLDRLEPVEARIVPEARGLGEHRHR
ncbi:hypothetical protein P3102_06600 [Amycolatopsis sp. QT-25]|nr:hypothetical protein [Amycolatopsis sp. QT-25]WET80899.1 hypothetical protein P3102_06600 [Amycolatopsis sp. QT-25]